MFARVSAKPINLINIFRLSYSKSAYFILNHIHQILRQNFVITVSLNQPLKNKAQLNYTYRWIIKRQPPLLMSLETKSLLAEKRQHSFAIAFFFSCLRGTGILFCLLFPIYVSLSLHLIPNMFSAFSRHKKLVLCLFKCALGRQFEA